MVDGLVACEPDLVEIRNRFVDGEPASRRKSLIEPSQAGVRLLSITE